MYNFAKWGLRCLGLGFAVMLVWKALEVRSAHAAGPRPGNEYQLLTQLNGQATRWFMPDGGASGVFTTYDGGAANGCGCMPLAGGTVPGAGGTWAFPPTTILIESTQSQYNLCIRPSASSPTWDGGCNTTDTDINYGVAAQLGVAQYSTLDSHATALCACTDAGFVRLPVWGSL